MTEHRNKIIHEGKYAAEVPVDLIEEEGGWSPYYGYEHRNGDSRSETLRQRARRLVRVPDPADMPEIVGSAVREVLGAAGGRSRKKP